MTENLRRNLLSLSVLAVFGFLALGSLDTTPRDTKAREDKFVDIHPKITVEGGAVRIKNNDTFAYDYCYVGINSTLGYAGASMGGITGGWRTQIGSIGSGQTRSVPLTSFVDEENHRFDIFTTRIQGVLIWCAAGGKSGLSNVGEF